MKPKLIHDQGWDLGEGWIVTLSPGSVVMVTYNHCASFEIQGDLLTIQKAISKALMNPIDPVPLEGNRELEGRNKGITLHAPHCRFDIPHGPARGLVEVLLQEVDRARLKEMKREGVRRG